METIRASRESTRKQGVDKISNLHYKDLLRIKYDVKQKQPLERITTQWEFNIPSMYYI